MKSDALDKVLGPSKDSEGGSSKSSAKDDAFKEFMSKVKAEDSAGAQEALEVFVSECSDSKHDYSEMTDDD